jgi:Carboxypeptidase regulatory-like domain
MAPSRIRRLAATTFIALGLHAQDELCSLVGRVVGPAGAPVASASLELARAGFGEIYRGTSDSSGRFEIKGLPPGLFRISVSSPFAYKIIDEFQVTAGKPADLGVVQLVLAKCGTLGGAICDEVQAARAPASGQRAASDIPVLTVCEVLRDSARYDGKTVVVVGRSVRTMEGSWLDEECAPQLVIDGRSWRPSVSTAYGVSEFAAPPQEPRGFKWDTGAIQAKLEAVQKTTSLRVYDDKSADKWLAVFGRMEAALPRKITLGNGRTGMIDGFGHMAGSPVQLVSPRDGFLQLN